MLRIALRAALVAGIVSAGAPMLTSCATGKAAPNAPLADQHPILQGREVVGVEHVVQVTERIYSGSEPRTDEAFAALRDLGVTTIISSDGKVPDVDTAARHGMTYVHVPIGYDGVPDEAAAQAIRATREAGGAVYFHCHHGLHRGPALAAAALQSETSCGVETVNQYLDLAKTSHEYKGLWRDALSYDTAKLSRMRVRLRDKVQPDNLHDAMHAVDRSYERLIESRDNGWQTPPKHPDVDPAHEAILLSQVFRELNRTDGSHPQEDFRAWMKQSEQESMLLSQAINAKDFKAADAHFKSIGASCKDCHRAYRN